MRQLLAPGRERGMEIILELLSYAPKKECHRCDRLIVLERGNLSRSIGFIRLPMSMHVRNFLAC